MHYYKKNIGDYAKKTGRLTMLQHGAYTLLIDACYDREKFPTKEQAMEWTWSSSKAEIEAVEFILGRFFVLDDDVYTQKRIKEEIDVYHKNANTNKRIAIEREAKRKEKRTNRERTVNEPPPNHKPLTRNQEPETKNQEKNTSKKITLKTFLSNCDKQGLKPIDESSIVFVNAEKIGIEFKMVEISWLRFKDSYTVDNPNKKYVNWVSVFNKAIKENWYKFWWTNPDSCVEWTSTGRQAIKLYGG